MDHVQTHHYPHDYTMAPAHGASLPDSSSHRHPSRPVASLIRMQRSLTSHSPMHWGTRTRLTLSLSALAVGGMVYVGIRPASDSLIGIWLGHWPTIGHWLAWLTPVHRWLPAFLHPFALSLLTMALHPDWGRHWRWGACGFWAAINVAAECGQIAATPFAALTHFPWLNEYFTAGIFDPWDIVAMGAGAACAAVVGDLTHQKRMNS